MTKKPISGILFICLGVMVIILAGCNWPLAKSENEPGTPTYEQFVSDCNTGALIVPGELIQPVPGCDNWAINRYERPFNPGEQDEYYPDLDVLSAELGRDDTWFYLKLALNDVSEDTEQLDGTYGIEIDWDRDGRGDILIAVETPGKYSDASWSVIGVQVWTDDNNDVGNAEPREPDLPYLGDGYDLLVFNQGDGADPEAAWARAILHQSAYVEMAFKANLLENPNAFVWWVWGDQGVVDPAGFDYHDSYDNAEAGDANDYMPYFPSNKVHRLDNTCSSLWGLPPDDDPSLCVNDPNFAGLECPPLDYDAFFTLFYSLYTGPPLTPQQEAKIYEAYKFHAGCGDRDGTSTPTLPDFYTETPTNTRETPTNTLETPTFTRETPTNTPETPTATATDRPCDFDCDCEPNQGENQYNCPKDCGEVCGNGVCGCGETSKNCKRDCGPACVCGDGDCEPACGETPNNCRTDCGGT